MHKEYEDMMRVKRVLHPVGHGAFFTEQFLEYANGSDKNVFNVVYDCGVQVNLPLLNQKIDDVFANTDRKHVDFLFISHLDKDHVSGIKYLIKKSYADAQTTFVLPLYKDYHLALYERLTGRAVLSIFNLIGQTQSKRVFYVPLSTEESYTDEGGEFDSIDMEAGIDFPDDESETINGLNGKVISVRTKFVLRQIWEYIPFNLHDSTSVDFFSKIESHPDLQIRNLNEVYSIFKNICSPNVKRKTPEQEKANKKFKALKEVYNSVGTPVANDRLININSLAVVSQAVVKVDVRLPIIDQMRYCALGFARYLYEYFSTYGYGACTYTGDLNLNQGKDFALFEKKVLTVLNGAPAFQLLQIPHHGSKTSYNKNFCGGLSGACFVNFNSENGIFDQRITYDFFCARKVLYPVTEIASSRYEMVMKVG